MTRPDLDAMMEFADKLPSLPTAVVKALQLLREENSQNDQIAAALSMDTALVGQMLKLANSPYYGVSRRVSTVQQAILVLGRKVVRSLVVAAAAGDFLSKPQAGYLLRRGELWSHSMAAGCGASLLSSKVGYRPPDEAFVAGLLHDIGKVVLSGYLAECSDDLDARLALSDDVPFATLEREFTGIDHATLGGMIIEHWQLPPHLASAIRFQLTPLEAGDDWKLAAIVHVANALALTIGVGVGVDGLQYGLDVQAVARLGLTDSDLDELIGALVEQVQDPAMK
ncbi:MAG: HDOD domain-containing protein [Fimbriimonadaceae bacterium]|nr:HDOD domain-containing protein [Fimbriimonadaceae bacterium]